MNSVDSTDQINSDIEIEEQKQTGYGWISYSFGATLFFSLTNSAMAEVSEKAG